MEVVSYMETNNKRIIESFWEKVDKKGEDECWNWIAYTNKDGYGTFNFDGVMVLVHRVAYILVYGEIPEGLHVLHRCDNPSCCNVNHLFLGTNQDNMKDRNDKGRQSKGESRPSAKLTQEEINEIRRIYANGVTIRVLAKEFDISNNEIRLIVNNQRWKDDNYKPVHIHGNTGENSGNAKLNWGKCEEIKERVNNGEKQKDIAREFGVSTATICNIVNNKIWKGGLFRNRENL